MQTSIQPHTRNFPLDEIFKRFLFCRETAMSFNRAAEPVVLRRRRSFGQRAGRSCELALTCFPKTFPQKFSLSPPKLVISPPPSKPSQPFCLPAPTPTAAIHTQTDKQQQQTSQKFTKSSWPHILTAREQVIVRLFQKPSF